jgi:hypothetical protein
MMNVLISITNAKISVPSHFIQGFEFEGLMLAKEEKMTTLY